MSRCLHVCKQLFVWSVPIIIENEREGVFKISTFVQSINLIFSILPKVSDCTQTLAQVNLFSGYLWWMVFMFSRQKEQWCTKFGKTLIRDKWITLSKFLFQTCCWLKLSETLYAGRLSWTEKIDRANSWKKYPLTQNEALLPKYESKTNIWCLNRSFYPDLWPKTCRLCFCESAQRVFLKFSWKKNHVLHKFTHPDLVTVSLLEWLTWFVLFYYEIVQTTGQFRCTNWFWVIFGKDSHWT